MLVYLALKVQETQVRATLSQVHIEPVTRTPAEPDCWMISAVEVDPSL